VHFGEAADFLRQPEKDFGLGALDLVDVAPEQQRDDGRKPDVRDGL
jgi:hypothetical protein